jgi:hypothetical protein
MPDDPARVRALNEAPPYNALVGILASTLKPLCWHVEQQGNGWLDTEDEHLPQGVADFRRIVVVARTDRGVFDWFFNSTHGYRAAYFRSPAEGVEANKLLLDAVSGVLLRDLPGGKRVQEFAAESFDCWSSKAWLVEAGKDCVQYGWAGEFSYNHPETPEILNGRWEASEGEPGRHGRRAPRGELLLFCGGFLDAKGNEWIAWNKRHRAEQIHRHGWT